MNHARYFSLRTEGLAGPVLAAPDIEYAIITDSKYYQAGRDPPLKAGSRLENCRDITH